MWSGFHNENGTLIISSFGITMFLAFLSCNILMRKTLREKKISVDIADSIIFWAALGGVIGAKIYYILEFGFSDLPQNPSVLDYIQNFGTGLVFYGGLIGGFISVSSYIYVKKLSWLDYADIVAPLLALGHGIGRIGCFLVPDCMGIESSFNYFPLAVSFPFEGGIHRYPTQLYEMFLYLMIFIYLYIHRHKVNFKGELFFEYLFLTGISRFLIEFLREHPLNDHGHSFFFFGLHGAQVISLLMIILGTILHYSFRQKY